jgi:hypothetical protein
MNTFLLRKAKTLIVEEWKHFSMWGWDCGSEACIAGWVGRLGGAQIRTNGTGDETNADIEGVRKMLKIDNRQFDRLCRFAGWPDVYKKAYFGAYVAGDYQRAAEIAAERIDWFISTDGME